MAGEKERKKKRETEKGRKRERVSYVNSSSKTAYCSDLKDLKDLWLLMKPVL